MNTPEKVTNLRHGDTIDEYQIERFINCGGSGLSGTYLTANQEVIKLFNLDNDSKRKAYDYEKFKNEAAILKSLESSENVVDAKSDFHETAIHNSHLKLAPYYVMEKMDGTLSDLLVDSSITLSDRLDIIQQVISGLIDVQAQEISHNDLRADNILFRLMGRKILCKIADFGAARTSFSETKNTVYTPMGPAYYSSPESIAGLMGGDNADKDIIKSSDIYSLGLVIYEVLTIKQQHDIHFALDRAYSEAAEKGLYTTNISKVNRLDYLRNVILPKINKNKVRKIEPNEVPMIDEAIAMRLNHIIADMLVGDYKYRLTDLQKISNEITDIQQAIVRL